MHLRLCRFARGAAAWLLALLRPACGRGPQARRGTGPASSSKVDGVGEVLRAALALARVADQALLCQQEGDYCRERGRASQEVCTIDCLQWRAHTTCNYSRAGGSTEARCFPQHNSKRQARSRHSAAGATTVLPGAAESKHRACQKGRRCRLRHGRQTANTAGQYSTPPAVPNTSYALTAVGAPRVECTASDASRHTSPPRRTWRGSKTTPSEGEEEHKGARGQEAEGVFEKHEP